MTDIDATNATDELTDSASDRRGLLAKLAVGGAGAAVGAVALGRTAIAADGENVRLGSEMENESSTPTTVRCTSEPPLMFSRDGAPTTRDPFLSGPSAWTCVSDSRDIATDPFAAACGGYGATDFINGVHGSTTNKEGYGCISANIAPPAEPDERAPKGTAIGCSNGPQLYFEPLPGAVSGPTPGLHDSGEVYCDADRTLWYTVPEPTASDPGAVRFVKLCGTGTSGAQTFLDFPVRVADTRLGIPAGKPPIRGNIVVDLKRALDGSASGVPAGISAALLTVTATNTFARGFFAVAAAGITIPSEAFSSGNWVGDNLSVAQTVQTRVNPDAEIQVQLGGNGNADIVVDVIATYA
ncbi:MAG: hypothetical protein AAGA42_08350 [Actinomycetota bacterium]